MTTKTGFALLKETDPERLTTISRLGGKARQAALRAKPKRVSAKERTLPLPYPPEFLR